MYTVQELIEALQKCPQDYPIMICGDDYYSQLMTIGIDNDSGLVELFGE